MEDRSKQDVDTVQEPRVGSGSLLASARKQQNKTVEEIAAELNLSVSQIKTIELDQTDGLPEPTYVRGYIRSYAKLLGLDSEQILQSYLNPNWQQSTNLDDMPRGIASADELSDKRFLTPTKVVVVVALAGIFGYLWYSGALDELINGEKGVSTLQSATSGDAENPAAVTIVGSESAETVAELQADTGTIADGDTVNQLLLNFSQTSWIDIRDADDNRLAYKSYAEGESLEVSNAGAMSVFIGNAEGVSVSLNGEPFDISAHREGVYAKFSVGEQ